MSPLRIEICNERFLPRFGVDRLLVLLASRLAESGHEVSFACLRCSKTMLSSITDDITVIEVAEGLDTTETETAVMAAMARRWESRRPHVLVTGGWPFFTSAAHAGASGIKSVFIDAGAVPQDGLTGPLLAIQQELRRIRQLTLPLIDRLLPISDFIRRTQTEPDRGNDCGVHTVLLGADHMAAGTFSGDARRDLSSRLDLLLGQGERLLLALGRFERLGYKNSPAAFDVLRLIRKKIPTVRLLILDAGQDCKVPLDLTMAVELLGAPGDQDLQEVMKRCVAGLSTSLWEGFNLPIAEMQWLGRPAFAFNLGAHPEIIADPWLLCESVEEMAAKAVTLLRGETPVELEPRFAAFRECRRWEATLKAWEHEIVDIAAAPRIEVTAEPGARPTRRIVLADVTYASLDPANPGVIRVTRRLCAELQQHPEIELILAAWSRDCGDYIFLDQTRRQLLEGYGGPRDGLGQLSERAGNIRPKQLIDLIGDGRSSAPILFLPEVLFDGEAAARENWARAHGYKPAAILYDLIPYFHQELCDPTVAAGFPAYLETLAQTDAVWSISDFTLSDFCRYAGAAGRSLPQIHETIWLPGQFGEQRPTDEPVPAANGDEIRILCVGTLEPRKNHHRLLEAFQKLRTRRPDLRVRLVLIGNRYAGALQIAEQVEAAARGDACIEWHGPVDDAALSREFQRAAFTVYPSLIEGFGLPILESLWMGRPCVAHDDGVMRELAQGGGCLTVDMADPNAIMKALEQMVNDGSARRRLSREARNRHITTWPEYADEIAKRLIRL